jgi:hypothetical protein
MKTKLAALALLLMSSGAASADDWDIKVQLGTVLGSDKACGLVFNQDAIQAYIVDHIKDIDPMFTSSLTDYIEATRSTTIPEMSKGVLDAHCVLVRKFAEQHGFISTVAGCSNRRLDPKVPLCSGDSSNQ